MARSAVVVAPHWLAASSFGRQCGLGVGFDHNHGGKTAICCALTKRQLHYFERKQLDSSKTLGWRLGGALLTTVVEGGRLDLATVVASGLLNADSQSLHLKALGWGRQLVG